MYEKRARGSVIFKVKNVWKTSTRLGYFQSKWSFFGGYVIAFLAVNFQYGMYFRGSAPRQRLGDCQTVAVLSRYRERVCGITEKD